MTNKASEPLKKFPLEKKKQKSWKTLNKLWNLELLTEHLFFFYKYLQRNTSVFQEEL